MNQETILKLHNINRQINSMLMESDNGVITNIRRFMSKKPKAVSSLAYCMKGLAIKLASSAATLVSKLKFWHMESEGNSDPKVHAKKISELAKNVSDMINNAIKNIKDTFTKEDALKLIGLALMGTTVFVLITIVIYNQSSGMSLFNELSKATNKALDSAKESVSKAFAILTDNNKGVIEKLVGFFKEMILAPFKSIIAGTSSLEDSHTISLTAAISSGIAIGVVAVYYIGKQVSV